VYTISYHVKSKTNEVVVVVVLILVVTDVGSVYVKVRFGRHVIRLIKIRTKWRLLLMRHMKVCSYVYIP